MLKKLKQWWNSLFLCEFSKKCKYYSENDYICKNGGDWYCGQYKEHIKLKNKKI